MGVAGDGGDAFDAEIEGFGGKAGFFEEGNEEGAEAGVDVEGDAALEGDFGQAGDVINDAVGEVGSGADDLEGVSGYRIVGFN